MSGHSKWSNIQHRKIHQDCIKSKKFSKIIKEIFIAAKNLKSNNYSFQLKKIISNAKSMNIPKHTINQAIKKAFNIQNSHKIKSFNIEGKILGVSMIIECMTDNYNRIISQLKNHFNKIGGSLCKHGELTHLFNHIGIFYIDKNNITLPIEEFELMSIDFGAKDFCIQQNMIYIYTDFKYFGLMKNYLFKLNIDYQSKIQWKAKHLQCISKKIQNKIFDFIKKIKINEDIKQIYCDI
ncbi:YebC/PmpR family DNA-binding transcriptional regulator [Blattabacterium cuenoti]|uniref:YebC/PmpR family DNA-binding transcriptional regulator n=1 Tax=Blattabacterium cuenoti TaxID=1653831 RepID=UPI00163C5ACA|nr:YebC/PmpR family DNA-binding transcriptional regulator [Blattabacterium cuenoti]